METDLFSEFETEEKKPEANIREVYMADAIERIKAMRDDPNMDIEDADVRFSTSLPLRMVRRAKVVIVGAGGLGNQQWKVVLGMGFRHLAIFDDDKVGIENVGSQGHNITDIGMLKVEAIKQAALLYRGIEIEAVPDRVHTYTELKDRLGYVPDIVITCTDSADFRSSFFHSLVEGRRGSSQLYLEIPYDYLPELWLDYRMSLGDWTCYAMPLRSMGKYGGSEEVAEYLAGYAKEALFSDHDEDLDSAMKIVEGDVLVIPDIGGDRQLRVVETTSMSVYVKADDGEVFSVTRGYDGKVIRKAQAVQERCTERGIIYTPFNVASYTGSFLHWLYTSYLKMFDDNREEAYEAVRDFLSGRLHMKPKVSYSARDWETITPTDTEESLRAKLAEARSMRDELEDRIEELMHEIKLMEDGSRREQEAAEHEEPEQEGTGELRILSESVSWGEMQPGNVVNFPQLDDQDVFCTVLEVHDNYALVQYGGDSGPMRVNIRFGNGIRRAVNAATVSAM